MDPIAYMFSEYGQRYIAWKRNEEGDRVFAKKIPVHSINGTGYRVEVVDSPFDATWALTQEELALLVHMGYHVSLIAVQVEGEKP